MKIAFIVVEFPALSETFILNQITGLLDMGNEVNIFALNKCKNGIFHEDVVKYKLLEHTFYFSPPHNLIKRFLLAIFFLIKNFHKAPIKILQSLNFFIFGKQALFLRLFYEFLPFLDKEYNIIFCHFGFIGNIGICLKQIGVEGKFVTMFHGADIRMEPKKGKIFYHKLFELGDKFLVASDYSYKKLVQFGADSQKIILHPVGINVKKFSGQLPSFVKKNSKIRIITVARLVEEKGLEYGIKTMRELLNNNPKINLEYNIIGGGPLEIPLRKLVRKLDLTNMVHFLGPMTQEEVIQEMKKAQIFFLPSISESFGVVLLEAQAMKLPVIATKVGGIPEAIVDKKSGFLVPAKDIKAMAEKIEFLIKNHKIRLEMRKYGRKFVEKYYNINKLNPRLIKIFQNLIAK